MQKRIAVISDLHGNLPALQAFLQDIQSKNIDEIYCLGDAIAIGPFPKECLDVLLNNPLVTMYMGNHERYYLKGVGVNPPEGMGDAEVEHQKWVHGLLENNYKSYKENFIYSSIKIIGRTKIYFTHYGIDGSGEFLKPERFSTVEYLESVFAAVEADIIIYGHSHAPSDLQGRKRYINAGSIGCCNDSFARYLILDQKNDDIEIIKCKVEYDKTMIFKELEMRGVPDREFISKIFFGGN